MQPHEANGKKSRARHEPIHLNHHASQTGKAHVDVMQDAAGDRVAPRSALALSRARRPPAMGYNGYIACPIVTGYGRMLLCELDYSGAPAP